MAVAVVAVATVPAVAAAMAAVAAATAAVVAADTRKQSFAAADLWCLKHRRHAVAFKLKH